MNNYFQDILINFIILFTAWFLARFTEKRSFFRTRTAICFVLFCAIRYLYFYHIIYLFGADNLKFPYIFGYVFLVILAVGAVLVCFKMSFSSALLCGVSGYCVQHICQRIYRLISRLYRMEAVWQYVLFIGLAVLTLLFMVFLVKRLNIRQIEVENKYMFGLALFVVLIDIYLDFERGITSFQYNNIMNILLTATVFLLLMNVLSNKQLENERNLLQEILKEERDQYRFEKSMIDMVNIKCHDLKHQIVALDSSAKQELKEQIQPVIEAYDSSFNTGNVALDVVLTRKNFSCKEKKIELTCMANGKGLGAFPETDVYSLFGNILDNAIEATEKIQDENRRIISLVVRQRDHFTFIHSENYYEGKLNFSDGLPLTTKGNVFLHGFGMKSIRSFVEKYGGSMKIFTKNERFVLEIVIPT